MENTAQSGFGQNPAEREEVSLFSLL
jgi:hypothetical protein